MGAVAAAFAEFFSADAVITGLTAAAGGAVASKLLAPSVQTPEVKPPTAMPDPLAQQKAKERSIIEQMARRGRQGSILTSPSGSETLGGGGV